jgi:hypothetical protein
MVVTLNENRTMKRYLFILLGALLFTSCEIIPGITGTANITMGDTNFECTEYSATITTDMPTVTLNGAAYSNYTLSLKYIDKASENVSEYIVVDIYYVINNKVTFNIEDLESNTQYIAYVTVDAGVFGSAYTTIIFTTKEHVPTCSIECDGEVEAKGIKASILLTGVAYKADGVAQEIANVRLEYCKAGNEDEWVAVDVENYNKAISIPANGDSYLSENTNYLYRVTITPEDNKLSSLTSEEMEFKTTYAKITADIDTPQLSIEGDTLNIVVESAKAYFDGETLPRYEDIEYGFIYRADGESEWSDLIASKPKNGALSHSMALNLLLEDTTYEFCGVIIAGPKNKEFTSDIATITTPKSDDGGTDDGGSDDGGSDDGGTDDGGSDDGDTDDGGSDDGGNEDDPITPPTPPISGDADTTELEGEWHLTSWRGNEPSFDVYLSITADGVVSLFQRIESREWQTFYSTVGYEDGIIFGKYTDGATWATSYHVSIDGDTMEWTDTTDSTDVSVYTRCTLPNMTNPEIRTASATGKRFL